MKDLVLIIDGNNIAIRASAGHRWFNKETGSGIP